MAYLTELERYRIETMLKDGYTQREIAARLGRHYNTINYEIKKGRVTLLNTDLTTRTEYCADSGQRIHEEHCKTKGRPLKVGNDLPFVRFIEDRILKDRYSPYAALVRAKGQFKTDICLATLYSYISHGIFLNVTNDDLPMKPKRKRNYKKVRRISYKNPHAKSIEDRPEEIETRETSGHWEGDTVVGGRGSKSCLFVLTERKGRKEVVAKLESKTASAVVRALDRLERAYGAESFRDTFRTITFDNGVEFSDTAGIEKNGRTVAYYAHPYSPHERGSNENQNKLIRRWVPKGENMDDLTDRDIDRLQKWLNNYPRRLFNGLSAAEYSNSTP